MLRVERETIQCVPLTMATRHNSANRALSKFPSLTAGLEMSPIMSRFRLVVDKLIHTHLTASQNGFVGSLFYMSYKPFTFKCCIVLFTPKYVEHGTPPKRRAPGLSRKVNFNANKNPKGEERSSKSGSLRTSMQRLTKFNV